MCILRANNLFLPTDKTDIYMHFSLQIFVILGSMDDSCLKLGQNKK